MVEYSNMIRGERPPGEAWVSVQASPDPRKLQDLVLVLEARGFASEARFVDGIWYLFVPSDHAEGARYELRAYARENAKPRGGERKIATIASGWPGVLLFVLVLVATAVLASQQWFDANWFVAGRADAEAIRGGEWWRIATALTLHADREHLAGNIVFGSFFGFFVAQYCGIGLGWAAILFAGSIGNAANALVQPAGHLSVGASTAVFAALGILVALVWRRGFLRNTPWRVRFAPIFAGVALLAYTGTAGENTDLGAHLFGFAAGACIGVPISSDSLLQDRRVQWIAAAAAASWLIASWSVALALATR